MRSLFIPLKSQFFEAFLRGDKTIEYRKYGTRWNERTCPVGRPVTLSKGYGTRHRLQGVIFSFEQRIIDSDAWISCYGEPGLAACIGIRLDRAARRQLRDRE